MSINGSNLSGGTRVCEESTNLKAPLLGLIYLMPVLNLPGIVAGSETPKTISEADHGVTATVKGKHPSDGS